MYVWFKFGEADQLLPKVVLNIKYRCVTDETTMLVPATRRDLQGKS
jgi:hypothetical protein